MKKRLRLALTLCIAMAFVVSCGGVAKTSKGRYAQALDQYDAVMDSFRYQHSMADTETQAKWDRSIAPILLQAGEALDNWKLAQNDVTKEQAYLALERQFMQLLFRYGILVKEK
jgi:hypothetical protein